MSEIISTKEFPLSVKLKISKVAILKNTIYSKEKSCVPQIQVLSFGQNRTVEVWPNSSVSHYKVRNMYKSKVLDFNRSFKDLNFSYTFQKQGTD